MRQFAGASSLAPERAGTEMSPRAQALVAMAYDDVPDPIIDYHVHLIATGNQTGGGYVSPAMRSWLHPLRRLRFEAFASASHVSDMAQADQQYLERLVRLARALPRRTWMALLAFDQTYGEDGTVDREHTALYVPNRYVWDVARRYPDVFIPVVSIHPYRKDASDAVAYWADRGVRMVKWLPNVMGIDPSNSRCDAFYEAMAAHNMILLTHGGSETSLHAVNQALGNPLRLRRALNQGVTVIVAHVAAQGKGDDLDQPSPSKETYYRLLLRLLAEPAYQGRLFADISALTSIGRHEVLTDVLRRSTLHSRLVNGSDYPVPAINFVIHLQPLVDRRLITPVQREALAEIFKYNPLLFDFVLKRTLRSPLTNQGFPPSLFAEHPQLRLTPP